MLSIAHYPETYRLLEQEGYLFQSSLTSGLTSLRAAGTHDKGKFYSALFNLSIGIERLCKTIIIIDRMLKNKMQSPSESEMRQLGHQITVLHNAVATIAADRSVPFMVLDLQVPTTIALVDLLDEFALRSRYHNLDGLGSGRKSNDPLMEWHKILVEVLKTDCRPSSVQRLLGRVNHSVSQIENDAIALAKGLDGRDLSLREAFSEPALQDMALKHVVLRLIQFLSPFRGLLGSLCSEVYAIPGHPGIPQMQEFLKWVWDDRTYVLRKRVWP